MSGPVDGVTLPGPGPAPERRPGPAPAPAGAEPTGAPPALAAPAAVAGAAPPAGVFFYGVHERIWHWVQAVAILALLATGWCVRAGGCGPVGLDVAARAHEGLGWFLVLNGALGLFHYATSGAIRQLVPPPRDTWTLALRQARYYLVGVFRGEPHPFARRPDARLNPLQQLTYLALLNGLLPLAVVTGLLLWGRERAPALGGTSTGTLFALHGLAAWGLLAFVVAHVYLTTTGETPLGALRAMLTGVEPAAPAGGHPAAPGAPGAPDVPAGGRGDEATAPAQAAVAGGEAGPLEAAPAGAAGAGAEGEVGGPDARGAPPDGAPGEVTS